MLFTSISFLYYFLPIVILVYFIVPKKFKNLVLLLASLAFYFYGEPKYVFLMIAEILIAYIGAICMGKYKSQSKVILTVTILIHVVLLGIFKYTDFLIGTINDIFNLKVSLVRLALPIGISFYTFQIISYLIDVYRGKVKVQKSFLKLATYVALFPQLIAGPIVRYETIEDELENRTHTFEKFSSGVTRFAIGLAKKVLIANMLGEFCSAFGSASEKTVVFYWLNAVSYMLQLYFDFSAYSDMAIGLGRMFGFEFLENFNYPYIAKTITEFWRRWHMSLSSWFKDYVYIPLGGNREGLKKQIRNIFVVWALTGLWHGASWNFVLWGVYFGVLLVIEKVFLKKYIEKMPRALQSIYVLFIVMVSFIIFNSNSLADVWQGIAGLFGANTVGIMSAETMYYLKSYLVVFIVAIIGATPVMKNLVQKLKKNDKMCKVINILEPVFIVVVLVVVTAYLVDNSYNPFLYFRF